MGEGEGLPGWPQGWVGARVAVCSLQWVAGVGGTQVGSGLVEECQDRRARGQVPRLQPSGGCGCMARGGHHTWDATVSARLHSFIPSGLHIQSLVITAVIY